MKKHYLLIAFAIFMISCEKAEIPDFLESKEKKFELSFEIIELSNAQDYKYLRTNLSVANKSFEKSSDKFSIDTTKINFIKTPDYISYTFRIQNNDALHNKIIQNLVISKGFKNAYRFHLFEYYLNEDQYLKILNGQGSRVVLPKASFITELSNLQFDASILNRSQQTCYVEVTSYEFCSHVDHVPDHADGTCSHPNRVTKYLEASCPVDTSGGNVSPIDESSPSGPGGGGDPSPSPSGDTTMSAPLGPEGEVLLDSFLLSLLETNPFLLLQIDCNQIPNWFQLVKDEATQDIKNKINNLPRTLFNAFSIQTLNGAKGTIANMDYFSVKVFTLPKKPYSNSRYTADEFLNYIRLNLNTLVDGSTFSPYCEISSLCTQETTLWNSNDPTGALVYIDIPVDPGVVICSEFQSNFWRFKTLNAPGAGNHPVSGTREFGYEQNADGSYTFYTRGVDRFDNNLIENVSYMTSYVQNLVLERNTKPNPFYEADKLWKSLQLGIEVYVNTRDGIAMAQEPDTNRPDWQLLKEVIDGVKPISELGCD